MHGLLNVKYSRKMKSMPTNPNWDIPEKQYTKHFKNLFKILIIRGSTRMPSVTIIVHAGYGWCIA